jgi:hypothetical protein
MTNKNISDFVAASMNAVLNSEQHKSLFNTQYKFASDENDARAKKDMCKECHKAQKECKCKSDSHSAWDSDDQLHVKDSHCAMCGQDEDNCYCWSADDSAMSSDSSSGHHSHMSSSDSSHAHDSAMSSDSHMSTSAALDVAIKGLLTASAALDAVGIDDGSAVSLKLASLIVEAKKEMSTADKKKLVAKLQKGKKDKKPAAKKPDPKKPESKKTDSKSSSKSTSSTSSNSSSSSSKAPFLKKLEVLKKKASDELIPLAKVMKAVKVVLSDEALISKLQSAFESRVSATSATLHDYIEVMLNHLDLEDLSKIVEAIYTMPSSL